MQNSDHNISFWEKRQFFRRKFAKIAVNNDHNIDPRWVFEKNVARPIFAKIYAKLLKKESIFVYFGASIEKGLKWREFN
jgi:hypothetical protein